MNTNNKWLTTRDAAEHINMSVQRLADLRMVDKGPKFYKPLGKVLYLVEDLDAWVKGKVDDE